METIDISRFSGQKLKTIIAEAEKFNLDCPILKACYLRMKIYKENLN